ncbi:hypothetical protein [Halostella pelagica]|uniref:hypothetical protein n=1 Tax=Halostella pelagica TaxID=2583824 RepID=UPI00108016F4|nr:hypothetical protein [Halostella pelagica]
MTKETTATEPRRTDGPDRDTIRQYLQWGVLVALLLLAAVSLLGFYTNATDAIALWVAAKYEPLFLAGFNLAVLLTSAVGVSYVLRSL